MGFLTPEPINEAFYVLVMCAAFMAVAMCRYLLSLVVVLEKRVDELEAAMYQKPTNANKQSLSYFDRMICPEKRKSKG